MINVACSHASHFSKVQCKMVQLQRDSSTPNYGCIANETYAFVIIASTHVHTTYSCHDIQNQGRPYV